MSDVMMGKIGVRLGHFTDLFLVITLTSNLKIHVL